MDRIIYPSIMGLEADPDMWVLSPFPWQDTLYLHKMVLFKYLFFIYLFIY